MKTAISTHSPSHLLPLALMALLTVACGDAYVNDQTDSEMNTAPATNSTTGDQPDNASDYNAQETVNANTAGGYNADGTVNPSGGYNKDGTQSSTTVATTPSSNDMNAKTWNTTGGYDAEGTPSNTGGYNADGTKRVVVVVVTAVQERAGALESMNGFRNVLMAELEDVRSHLNKGTLPEEHADADQQRAAELAQGLARVDKALEAMKETTADNWKDLREVQLKELDAVRSWWNGYLESRPVSASQ